MKQILVHKQFSHADDIYPVEVTLGKYGIGKKTDPAEGIVSPRCAEVALENEWAEEVDVESSGEGADGETETSIVDRIVAVIPDLDREKDYTGGGVPKTEAIAALIKEPVTAGQRDEAVAIVQSKESD